MTKKGLIGVQMSTIAPNKMPKFDAYESMARLADIGYKCIEISQVPMSQENVAGFRRAIDELGFNVAAVSALTAANPMLPGCDMSNPDEMKKMIEDAKYLDCDMFRIGAMPLEARFSLQAAVDFAKQADDFACQLKEHGIDLYYHNHHFEFVRHGGKFLMDIIKENTKYLGFELDIHWIHRGGMDPVKFINQYAGRIRLLHLKDYRIAAMEMEENADFSTKEGMMKAYAAMNNIVQFAEVGEGTLDIPACIEAGLAGGSEYFLVEQDLSYGRDPFDCLKTSHDNLVKMGYGDWF
ncbi:MAG: sugar phosphate isomerase/epimerase [Oscillospiraceae bacterium]